MADDTGEIGREAAEAVGFTDIKVVGEGPAFLSNLSYANAVSAGHNMNTLAAAIVAKSAEQIMATSPGEGVVDTAIAQILAKIGQTTPPITVGTPSG